MENDLAALSRIAAEQQLMLVQITKLLETDIAIREAHTSILQTLTAIVRNDPNFHRLLSDVHAKRLNQQIGMDVDNRFIQTYIDNVNTFLPEEWKYSSMTAPLKK